ncbi:MAG TPA: hypothetical protein GX720_01350 [Clostridiaceae bacterium]|nr:hypothetical protein [Clostridiaceae bacterium]
MHNDYHTIRNYPVKLQDCDPAGKIHLHRLMDYAQDADDENCRLLGVNDQVLRKKNACWIVLANVFHFSGDFPRGGEPLVVDTWSRGKKGIRFYRNNLYYRGNVSKENLVGASASEWILCDADTHRPVRPPAVIDVEAFLAAGSKEANPAGIERLKTPLNPSAKPPLFSYLTGYGDLDFNIHMHNTHYARLAVDAAAKTAGLDPWTQTFTIRRFHIQYNCETAFDSTLALYTTPLAEGLVEVAGFCGGTNSFIARVDYEISGRRV